MPNALENPANPTVGLFAVNGIEVIADTGSHAGSFYLYHAFTSTVIATITTADNVTGSTLVGATIPAGHDLPCQFTAITLTSGFGFAAKQ